ncbi:MAG: hypothetical protein EOO45_00270 [Flavobacterium sp.]|nr:MAG: hypothetical protein EOO45_00270 [Flavobacterium sp.]
MKYIYLFMLFMASLSSNLWSQEVSLGNSGGYYGWLCLGTLNLQQQGADAYIDIVSGNGYNAGLDQNGECHIHLRTSNGINSSNGVYAAGSFYNTGRTSIVSFIRVVQINSSTWELYAVLPSFTGQEAIFSLRSVSGSWQSSIARLDPSIWFNISRLD